MAVEIISLISVSFFIYIYMGPGIISLHKSMGPGIKLATPGFAVRHLSAVRHVTVCTMHHLP